MVYRKVSDLYRNRKEVCDFLHHRMYLFAYDGIDGTSWLVELVLIVYALFLCTSFADMDFRMFSRLLPFHFLSSSIHLFLSLALINSRSIFVILIPPSRQKGPLQGDLPSFCYPWNFHAFSTRTSNYILTLHTLHSFCSDTPFLYSLTFLDLTYDLCDFYASLLWWASCCVGSPLKSKLKNPCLFQ